MIIAAVKHYSFNRFGFVLVDRIMLDNDILSVWREVVTLPITDTAQLSRGEWAVSGPNSLLLALPLLLVVESHKKDGHLLPGLFVLSLVKKF